MSERYSNDPRVNLDQQLGTAQSVRKIREALKLGKLSVIKTIIVTGADRLDTIAGNVYGDARYWWLLAAASNIGWGMQIPPGTVVNVVNINDAKEFI